MACWQLSSCFVPRVCTLSVASRSRTSHVCGSRKMSTGGMRTTCLIWKDNRDNREYKRSHSIIRKGFNSCLATCRVPIEDSHRVCKIGTGNEPVTGNGKFHLTLNIKIKRGFVRCSLDVPVPSHGLPQKDPTRNVNEEQLMHTISRSETKTEAGPVKAAFFDVDGTITRTNVVLAYFAVRMTELSYLMKLLWVPCFAVLCLFYLLVDHFDRPTFNRIFYANHYKGRSADGKTSMAALVYERYYKPRIFAGALEHIRELKQLGYRIVLVTGALDFQIEPLARELGADFVYAAQLVEEDGRYSGKLNGMATSNSEKAERVLDYAKRFDVSLEDSLAFGDSIADVSMLEMVGRPHAVNPDARLLAVALQRKWTVLSWTLQTSKTNTAAQPLPV